MKQDLTGRRFGYLTVLGKSSRGDARHPYWACLCDCGNRKTVEESHLKNGHTKSCGCYRKKVLSGLTTDLSGLRFGGLTAIGAVPGTDGRDTYWLCRCDCGNWMVCQQDSLRQGLAKCCEACRDKRRAGKLRLQRKRKLTRYSGSPDGSCMQTIRAAGKASIKRAKTAGALLSAFTARSTISGLSRPTKTP